MTITREILAHNYSGSDPTKPPPMCYQVPLRNRAPAQKRVLGGGTQALAFKPFRGMMDPADPSTWQRPYWFDQMPVIRDPDYQFPARRADPDPPRGRPHWLGRRR